MSDPIITHPNFRSNFISLKIQKALKTVTEVEILFPKLIISNMNPMSVPITIKKSNWFQEFLKYENPHPRILIAASRLKMREKK